MQPSQQPRQADPRDGRRRRSGASRAFLVGLPLLIFGAFATVAVVSFLVIVGVFLAYSEDLPDPKTLTEIQIAQESIIYARDGKTVLARFSGNERREVVQRFDQLPPILVDATTAVEDKTFWTNAGFDPLGIVAAAIDSLRGNARGASTVTQQLVRQRLLRPELLQGGRLGERKIKEIIQSIRLTQTFSKQQIILAYLNQNFYGNNSYGVKTAARSYFGIANLSRLTIAQAAILAALPKSPGTLDLVRNAVETEIGDPRCPEPDRSCLVVPASSAIVIRRNYILGLLAGEASRRYLVGETYSKEDYLAAMVEPVVLVNQGLPPWNAPHFVWYVRQQLAQALCGNAETCTRLEQGGLRIVTTLDWRIQRIAEKWVQAAALVPHRSDPAGSAERLGVPYTAWMQNLRTKRLWNGALSAIDYQTGQIIAYVGSANYYETRKVKKEFQPQFDVLSNGWRQPGSAFKPFNYVTGINDRSLTASTMLMDVTTDFGGGYAPTDFDRLERGPLRLRLALQFSLNIPSIKALTINGEGRVFDMAKAFGMQFQRKKPTAGKSMALGTLEVHPLDLATAYATLANRGKYLGHAAILSVKNTSGEDVIPPYVTPEGTQVVSPQAAYVITDILAGNTLPDINPVWGRMEVRTAAGEHRPATLKTGTNNDAKDLSAYGYIAPPTRDGRANGEYALVVGVWNGNSDGSTVSTAADPIFSLDVAAPLWQAVMREATRGWAVNNFRRPDGLVDAQVDAFTGFRPTVWSQRRVKEIFLDGTVPGDDPYIRGIIVVRGLDGRDYRWKDSCTGEPVTRGYLALGDAEADHPGWQSANRGWIARARKGAGVSGGPNRQRPTATAWFYQPTFQPYGRSWGAPFAPTASCDSAPTPPPSASLPPSVAPTDTPLDTATPGPTDEPTPGPTKTPKPPTPEPTPEATPEPPTPEPTPEPTPAPP